MYADELAYSQRGSHLVCTSQYVCTWNSRDVLCSLVLCC